MEIERKYLVPKLPEHLEHYPCRIISQGYLNTDPVVRIRQDDHKYELTYKSKGFLARQEYNLPLNREKKNLTVETIVSHSVCTLLSTLPCLQMFTAMTCWSGTRPLGSATLSIQEAHWDSC